MEECTYWNYPDKDPLTPQTMTVEFGGEYYTGKFKRTTVVAPRVSRWNIYKFDGGEFGVNAENNQVEYFSNSRYSKGELSQEECEKIAAQIAGGYIDIDQYELRTECNGSLYCFEYNRLVNGVQTSDEVYVVISSGGDLFNLGLGTLNAFSTQNLRSDEAKRTIEVLSSEKADEALSEKIDTLYASRAKTKYPDADITCTYSCRCDFLVSLPDGTVGRLYEGEVIIIIKNEGKTLREAALIRILVKCE